MTELTDTLNNGETEVLVVPKGQFYGSDSEGNPIPESIDETVIDALVEQLKDQELLVDKDHSSVKKGTEKDTSAMGWMYSFKKGVEGLWAKIRWTNIGRNLVENRVFRFLSPVFTLNGNKPTNMLNVALTNKPAFQDKAKPIINNKPNMEEIEMTMTKEELVELIKQTIIDLKKEKKVAELDEAIEDENEFHEEIVDNLEQEKKDVEAGVAQNSKPSKTNCQNACSDDKDEKPVENECVDKKPEAKNAEVDEQVTDEMKMEVKEELQEGKAEGKSEEEIKEEVKEEIAEEKEDAEQVSKDAEQVSKDAEQVSKDKKEEVIKLEALNSTSKTEGIDIVKNFAPTHTSAKGYAITTIVR